MIKINEIQYKNFGRCLEMTNGIIRLVVTLDFGPRVIRYSFSDGKNIFFEDTHRVFQELNPQMEAVYGSGKPWIIYGGHRLWKSPETMPETYYPDNESVAYTLTPNGAVFTPPVQKWTNYAYEIVITLNESGSDVTVEHRVTNRGKESAEFSLWAISVMSGEGVEIVPQPSRKTGMSPKMKMAFWDYVDMTDKRLTWLKNYIVLRQDPDADGRMKFGINNEHGFAMYFNHGDMFLNQYDPVTDGTYPDGGMSFETFTNNLFLEMETLGELKTIGVGETIRHTERWSLHKEEMPELNDDQIDKLKEKYLNLY